jgi:hypothetical protein
MKCSSSPGMKDWIAQFCFDGSYHSQKDPTREVKDLWRVLSLKSFPMIPSSRMDHSGSLRRSDLDVIFSRLSPHPPLSVFHLPLFDHRPIS